MISKYAAFFGLLFCSIVCFGQSRQSDSLYAIGVELYNQARYEEAIPYFVESDKLDKTELDSMSNRRYYSIQWLASCYYKMGDQSQAEKIYGTVCRLQPVDRRITVVSDSLSTDASIDLNNKRFDKALNKIESVAKMEKRLLGEDHWFLIGTLRTMANCNIGLGKIKDAQANAEKAIMIEKKNFGTSDTLLLPDLNSLFTLCLYTNDFDKARKTNEEIAVIVGKHYIECHVNHVDVAYRRLLLLLWERRWKDAHEALPGYIEMLKHCYEDNPERLLKCLSQIHNNFYESGRMKDAEYISNAAKSVVSQSDPHIALDASMISYMGHFASQNWAALLADEEKIMRVLQEFPQDTLQKERATIECLKCMRLLFSNQLEEANLQYQKIQNDSLQQYLVGTELYPVFILAKGGIELNNFDYESGIETYTEYLGLLDTAQMVKNLSMMVNLASLHAIVGNYSKANELTDNVIGLYERHVIGNNASYRIEQDTMILSQCIANVQKHIEQSFFFIADSARYLLHDIKGKLLLFNAKVLSIIEYYPLNRGYARTITAYAFELTKMGKYPEAQKTINDYLNVIYESVERKAEKNGGRFFDADWDLIEDVLYFKKAHCYEKGDSAGAQAHLDYLDYLKMQYGEESVNYFNAMVNYYDYIGDNTSLVSYLSSAIDKKPRDYNPYAFRLAADACAHEGLMDQSVKYRKGYVNAMLRDVAHGKGMTGDLLKEVDVIASYYIKEKKDTTALLDYLKNELWPSLDAFGDDYLTYFLESLDKLCFKVDDDSFIPYVEKEMKRKRKIFKSSAVRGCVDDCVAGVLSRGNKCRSLAVDYMGKACKEVEGDSILHLLFACRLHYVLYRCLPDSIAPAIALGNKLIGVMGSDDQWKYTHEYSKLVERQLELLQKDKRYDEVISIGQAYLDDFSSFESRNLRSYINSFANKDKKKLVRLLNETHPLYKQIEAINRTSLNSWSTGASLPEVCEILYETLLKQDRSKSGDYALKVVHEQYKHLETSMAINSVSTYQCDNLISLTTKLAYTHQTDSLYAYAYNTALLCKGLQLRSNHAVRTLIKRSGHQNALRKFDQLQHIKRQMAHASKDELNQLSEQSEKLEKELFNLSRYFGDYTRSLYSSWSDVQKNLANNDMAVEFTLVKKDYDGLDVSDNSTFKEGYYACILRKGMARPEIVYVCPSDSLDVSLSAYSSTAVTRRLFSPLSPYLDGVENIYFSPIGKLNQLSIESLPQMDNASSLLSSKYNFFRLSSTRSLIKDNFQFTGKNAAVYGGLLYQASVDAMKQDAQKHGVKFSRDVETVTEFDVEGLRGAIKGIPYLEGTKIEAENIARIINTANDTLLEAQLNEGISGTEASFKALDGKGMRIIHLATHGFYFKKEESKNIQFLSDSDVGSLSIEDQSLMRSGLFMTGAENKYLGVVVPNGVEDGILTSQEIANTDLTGLDLCVLSACQTAQGDINSEGVFGLQRGFKKAGANSILMSLWKVDDDATCMLMTEFYNNWIVKKMTKHDALEEAKKAVRMHKEKGWDNPNYWAAFILLDALD